MLRKKSEALIKRNIMCTGIKVITVDTKTIDIKTYTNNFIRLFQIRTQKKNNKNVTNQRLGERVKKTAKMSIHTRKRLMRWLNTFGYKKRKKIKMALLTNSASATGPTAGGPTAPQAHSATPLHHYFHYLKQPSPLAQNPYAHHSSAHHMGMGPGPLGGLGPFGLTPHGLEAVGFPQGKIFL